MKVSSETLPGLFMEPWGEVTEDLYDIARRIKEKDLTTRLVANRDSGVLALAKYIDNQEWMPEPGWVVAMRFKDYEEEDHLFRGIPDARLLTQMDKCDLHKRDVKEEAQKFRVMHKMQELQQAARDRERAAPLAEKTLHRWRKKRGLKAPKIYIPR